MSSTITATPKPVAAAKSHPSTASTPNVTGFIPVPSNETVSTYQQQFESVCQEYIDQDGWTTEQQRVLGDVFDKFVHNVFATVRKNVTTSTTNTSASFRPSSRSGMVEPLDRGLVAEVQVLDEKLDEVSGRVAELRREVPLLLDQMLKKQSEMPVAVSGNGNSSSENSASDSSGPVTEKTGTGTWAVGSVISHVANEIKVLAEEFQDVKKDVDTAVSDCSSTLQVVKDTLSKPESKTTKAIFMANDISNSQKRKVSATKGASAKKRAALVNKKENQ